MGGLVSRLIGGAEKPKLPPLPETPEEPAEDSAAAAAAAEATRQNQRRRGRASTILTGQTPALQGANVGTTVLTGR